MTRTDTDNNDLGQPTRSDLNRWLSHGQAESGTSGVNSYSAHRASGSKSKHDSETVRLSKIQGEHDQQRLEYLKKLGADTVVPEPDSLSVELQSLSGDTVNSASWSGRWVLLNFWASWCHPCREETPDLAKLSHQMADTRLTVVGINVEESRDKINRFSDQFRLPFRVLLDRQGQVAEQFRVRVLPTTWLLSPEGEVAGRIVGPREWKPDVMRGIIGP